MTHCQLAALFMQVLGIHPFALASFDDILVCPQLGGLAPMECKADNVQELESGVREARVGKDRTRLATLLESISDRYRPDMNPVWPITGQYRLDRI